MELSALVGVDKAQPESPSSRFFASGTLELCERPTTQKKAKAKRERSSDALENQETIPGPPSPAAKQPRLAEPSKRPGRNMFDLLPDSLLQKIYGYAAKRVCRHSEISKRLRKVLPRSDHVVLRALFCSKQTKMQPGDLLRYPYRVTLSARHCAGVASVLCTAIDEGWRGLVSLDLGFNQLDDRAVEELAERLPLCTQLKSLTLCDNNFGGGGACHIARALEALPWLEKLTLSHNTIATGVDMLAHALASVTALRSLDVSHVSFGDEGATRLAEALVCNTLLTELDVSSCLLSPIGAYLLMRACPRLESLHLDGNVLPLHLHLGAGLAWSFGRCSSLTNLSLFNCALRREGAIAMALSLPECPNLRKLHLGWNKMGSECVWHLLPAFQTLTALATLDLTGNNVSAEAVRHGVMVALEGTNVLI